MSAVCQKCGASKENFAFVCPACAHRPEGEGLLVAWLLSTEHLKPAALEAAAKRVASGHPLRPSATMLKKARRALKRDIVSDPGLTTRERLGLLGCSLLFTPLVGWTCFFWWYADRPRAAWQSLALSLPFSLLFTGLWGTVIFG